MEIISELIEIKCQKPTLDFIEKHFKEHNLSVLRWAIVEVKNDILLLECAILK